ncbi:AAA family ATPase [Kiloniella laminariae]|uniref:AAA family ATPase n=1 Tax=Kiloniella laminariae TaxID=454162 RepID=UPI00036CE461|nr:AAA family ATPase [Kiloniella laminariae]
MNKNAQIITALQQKGGAGKSTMISCLAAVMAEDGARVVIIDTDQQKSCMEWAEERELPNLDVVSHLSEDTLFDLVEKLEKSYDVILIDTAGYDSRMATYAIQISNLLLIPSGGSKKDIKGAARTWLHANNLTKRNKEAPEIKIVIWKVKKGTNVLAHAKNSLIESELPVLPTIVPALIGFDVISWNGGLPEGSARAAVNEFVASLQIEGHLKYYVKGAA